MKTAEPSRRDVRVSWLGVLIFGASALGCTDPSGSGGDDAEPAGDMTLVDAGFDGEAADGPPIEPDGAAEADAGGSPDADVEPDAAPPLDLELRTAWGGEDSLSLFTDGIFAVWWDPRFDHADDAAFITAHLEGVRRDCIDDLDMADPPNPGAGSFYNVYIHHGEDDALPVEWGNGQGTDRFGMPFLTLPVGAHIQPSNLDHEGFHIFQYSADASGFAYRGDSQWYVESSAQWYAAEQDPTGELTFVEAGAIVGNPQLALWHSFANEAPGDPTDWLFQVRQYGMHTYLYFMTVIGGVDRDVVSGGFYSGTVLSPQAWHYDNVGGPALRSVFADWAARNTGGLDYLTPEQVARAALEVEFVADPDNLAPYAIELDAEGTGGAFVRPPDALAPRGWAYNVVRISIAGPATYAIRVEGDGAGSEGAPSHFMFRTVVMGVDGPMYGDVADADPLTAEFEIDARADDAEVFVVIASVPEHFTGNQTYGYGIRVERSP